MKKLFAIAILLVCFSVSYPQTVLKFCVEADSTGACKSQSLQFLISKDGGTISFLLKNDRGLGVTHVVYRIFKIDEDGKENYNSDIDQRVERDWNFAWEDAVFYDPGNYIVKVYDISGKENLICSGTISIYRDY